MPRSMFKHDLEPRTVERRRKRAEAEADLREAYEEVDARDGGFCWVTGRYTQSGHVDARCRREHHHLEPRSVAPERRADPHNIVTVCAEAHSLFKVGWLVSEGKDARKPVFFHYTELAKSKPFLIQTRREI